MLIKLVVVGYLTRTLTPEEFGVLGFGTALGSYFILSITLGLNKIGTREVARGTRSIPAIAGQITGLRLVLSAIALVAYVGVVAILPHPFSAKLVFLIQGIMLPFYALNVEWVYEGVQRMGLVAVRRILADILYLVGVLLLVRNEGDVILAAAAATASFALGVLWLLSTYLRDFKRLPFLAEGIGWRFLAKTTLPFAISLFLLSIYTNLDKIMLGLMKDSSEVGYYEASLRLYGVATAPVMIIVSAFFPVLSQFIDQLPLRRKGAASLAKIQLSIGPLVAAAGVALAEPLIILLAGNEYRHATPVVRILMFSSWAVFASGAIAQPLLAWNKERVFLVAVLGGAVLNVLFNFLLIPRWSMLGAAWATFAAEIIVIFIALVPYVRAAHYNPMSDFVRGAFTASIAIGIPVWLSHIFHWPWPILLAVLIITSILSLAILRIPQSLMAVSQQNATSTTNE